MSALPPKADGVDGSRSRHRGAKVVVVINHDIEMIKTPLRPRPPSGPPVGGHEVGA